MAHKLVVVSFDSLQSNDIDALKNAEFLANHQKGSSGKSGTPDLPNADLSYSYDHGYWRSTDETWNHS